MITAWRNVDWWVRMAWWAVRHWLPWRVYVWQYGRMWDKGLSEDTEVHRRAWDHYRRTGQLYITED